MWRLDPKKHVFSERLVTQLYFALITIIYDYNLPDKVFLDFNKITSLPFYTSIFIHYIVIIWSYIVTQQLDYKDDIF